MSDDSGFSLVSVIIAFSMFVAVLAPAAALMQRSSLVSGNVENRVVASNLATQELEVVRSQGKKEKERKKKKKRTPKIKQKKK